MYGILIAFTIMEDFVDDMIFFGNSKNEIIRLSQKLNIYLDGLEVNPDKTKHYNGDSISKNNPLDYLGYRFHTVKKGKKKNLVVTIADKKINKIKTRLVKSFLQHNKDRDHELLESRIKFLNW